MARPSINEEDHSVGHQISFPPDLWVEFSQAVAEEKTSTRSGVIQDLIRGWLKRRREARMIERYPELEREIADLRARLAALEARNG